MISYIKWKIIELDFNYLTILTASGLGYELGINELIYSKITKEEEIELFVYHHKTENSEALFWFIESREKKVFTELVKISWIWGKVAMQILSLWVDRLLTATKSEDNKTIESIKWVGKKMAEKIILEFRDKDFWLEILLQKNTEKKSSNLDENLLSSIKSTLTNMWYNPKDVENILQDLPAEMNDIWTIISYVVKNI